MLRTTPCLLGLFSVVSLLFARHVARHGAHAAQRPWYKKDEPTFADALAQVRRVLWAEILLPGPCKTRVLPKLPRRIRTLLLDRLAAAA